MGEQEKGRRPWGWWLGLGLVVGGLAVLGWVAWQFWGTNWLAKRTHDRIVTEVREQWDAPAGAAEAVQVPEGEVTALVRIPRFGDDYVVPVLEGTSDDVLAAGYGHFEHSAKPGRVGNFAISAHRVTHGEPLRDMPELQAGDEVVVETRRATLTYVLTTGGDDLEVSFRDTWVVDPLPSNPDPGGVQPEQVAGQRLITLATCAEIFHTDNRLVAFGVLKERSPRR